MAGSSVFLIAIVIVILFIGVAFLQGTLGKKKRTGSPKYIYKAKSSMMSQREADFFKTLTEIFDQKSYIAPQVHLSALLNHEIKGQNWKNAFRHINGKSVDFVLLSKDTLRPICAIELDDYTHERADRITRDAEVERIFREVKIPLVRFRSPEDMTRQEIVDTIALTIKATR